MGRNVVSAAALVVALLAPAPLLAAEAPVIPPALAEKVRDLDLTNTPLAQRVSLQLQLGALERASRARIAPTTTASAIAGWTVTQVGNYVIVQDDGSHGCANLDLTTGAGFDTCIGGGPNLGGGSTGAVDAFYDAFPDANPTFLATYLAWDTQTFGAFYAPVASDTIGIGTEHIEPATFGDVTKLNGWIFMNSIQMYNALGPTEEPMLYDLVWGQELEHRWAMYVHFKDGTADSSKLIGRQQAHWSWYVDTMWSWMEGNHWKDVGGGKFSTDMSTFDLSVSHKCPMDLYLMGLIPPAAVPPFMLISNPSGGGAASQPPQFESGANASVKGTKKMVTVDDVIAAEGERSPTWTEQPRRFQVATLIILRSVDDANDAAMRAMMQQYTDGETTQFALETHGLAHVDTSLAPLAPNADPTAAFSLPATATAKKDAVLLDASASSDSDGNVKGWAWDFGDGTGDFSSGAKPTHVFQKSGTLTVTLTAVDDQGGANTITHTIDVAPAPSSHSGCECDATGGAADPATAWAAFGALALFARWRRARRRG